MSRTECDGNCAEEDAACFGPPVVPRVMQTARKVSMTACEDENCIRQCIFQSSRDGFDAAVALDTCGNENDCPDRDGRAP